MKYLRLILLFLLPTTGLFAQISDPDSLYYTPDSLEFNDSNIPERILEQSTMMEMLDMVSNISYFNDIYLDIDSAEMNVYGYGRDEVPIFPDSIYEQRIRALARETTMPLTYNHKVKSFIDLYANKKRRQSSRMLGLSYVYFPMFEEMLGKYNLPLELKYLAMVESALNPTAGSRAGAKGLWQFMFATGKDYGLKINSLVDERYDPMKETEAACKFLKSLYARYGDWFLVLAAYNSGPGTVNKAILRSGGMKNYWSISRYLPQETQNYVPAFIAVTYLMNYASAHNIYPLNPGLLLSGTDTVMVRDYIAFDHISKYVGVPNNDIEFFNPQYTKKIIPASADNQYVLRLPMKYSLRFVQVEDSIYAYAKKTEIKKQAVEKRREQDSPASSITHTVKKGESLGSIAKKYGVTVPNLKKWNKLKNNTVHPGQRLTIYRSGSAPKSSGNKSKAVSSKGSVKIHTVKKGETLSSIANKYKCTVSDIKKWNNLKSNNVKVGQKLKIKK